MRESTLPLCRFNVAARGAETREPLTENVAFT